MKKILLLTILAVALLISIISFNESNQAIGQCSYQNVMMALQALVVVIFNQNMKLYYFR